MEQIKAMDMIKKFRKHIIMIAIGFIPMICNAQDNHHKEVLIRNGWIAMDSSSFHGLFLQNPGFVKTGMSQDDTLVLCSTETDDIGFTHWTYQQYHDTILVEDAIYKIHSNEEHRIVCNGYYMDNIKHDTLENSMTKNEIKERNIQYFSSDSIVQWDIVYSRENDSMSMHGENFRCMYRVQTEKSGVLYFDVFSGELIKKRSRSLCAGDNRVATVHTLFNGDQQINVTYMISGIIGHHYNYLVDRTRGNYIYAWSFNNNNYSLNQMNENNIIKSYYLNDWNADSLRIPATIYWAMEKTYDFFLNEFNRNSYDNHGIQINIIPWCDYWNEGGVVLTCDNALWSSRRKAFVFLKQGQLTHHPVASLDVVGHEYTHGIIEYSSNLNSSVEARALNESFSDIFGTMVEYSIEGESGDYLIGEDFWIQDGKLRDMENPNSKLHPDTYHGQYWQYSQDTDYSHINAGVQNYWFYLLSEGGTGVNDNEIPYHVTGIGRDKAARIAYRNMTVYLTSVASFSDAKNGAIMSAVDLYGINSNEVLQTILAWDAVGVSSVDGIHYDYDMSSQCDWYTMSHNDGMPVCVYTVGTLRSNCAFVANNTEVRFAAGKEIILSDGFESGDNFIATPISTITPKLNQRTETPTNDIIKTDITITNSLPENKAENQVKAFPNPAINRLTISLPLLRHVVVYTSLGEQILSVHCNKGDEITIDMTQFEKGMYVVKSINQEGQIYTSKVIKQ